MKSILSKSYIFLYNERMKRIHLRYYKNKRKKLLKSLEDALDRENKSMLIESKTLSEPCPILQNSEIFFYDKNGDRVISPELLRIVEERKRTKTLITFSSDEISETQECKDIGEEWSFKGRTILQRISICDRNISELS